MAGLLICTRSRRHTDGQTILHTGGGGGVDSTSHCILFPFSHPFSQPASQMSVVFECLSFAQTALKTKQQQHHIHLQTCDDDDDDRDHPGQSAVVVAHARPAAAAFTCKPRADTPFAQKRGVVNRIVCEPLCVRVKTKINT